MGVVGAERVQAICATGSPAASSSGPTSSASSSPLRADELAAQVIALLLGSAFQHRLEPAAIPEDIVISGLTRLLGLDAASNPPPTSDLTLNPPSGGSTP